MRSYLIILQIICLILPSFAFGENRTQYAYMHSGGNSGHGDVIHQNSTYYKCEIKSKCKGNMGGKFAIFLKSDETKEVVPTFLQCTTEEHAVITMDEALIPVFNQAVKETTLDCFDTSSITDPTSLRLAEETLEAMKGYENGCPKEDRNCIEQIGGLVVKDFKNALNIFGLGGDSESQSTEMGCLSNFLYNVYESLITTIKLLLWDIPKAGIRLIKSAWNYFFEEEKQTTEAMVLASVLPEDMADAIASLDFPKLYSIVRKNFLEFLGNIRKFYSELLGCTEWQGKPFESECLKKTNWSCPTCEGMINFACGLAGQLGTGFLLGGILGTAKSLASLSKYQKQVSNKPSLYGMTKEAIDEMKSKQVIADTIEQSRYLKHRAVQTVRPISNTLRAATDEVKMLFGMGGAFQKLVQGNPVTMPYHLSYQAGKTQAFTRVHNYMLNKTGGTGVHLSKKYAFHLESVSSEFSKNILAMKKIAGDKFHPRIYNNIVDNYLKKVEVELAQVGVKTSRIDGPNGMGLRLEKGGESFDYYPRFEDKLKNYGHLDNDALKTALTMDDPILGGANAYAGGKSVGPTFLKEMQERARDSKNLYAIKPDGRDGLVYLGHFFAQEGSVPQTKNCGQFLDGYDHFDTHDISKDANFQP